MPEYLFREDTIAAISTPGGRGAIGILRVSGPGSVEVVSKIWRGPSLDDLPSRTFSLGKLLDEKNEILDEALIVRMRAPASYTGEDLIEIHCHGNPHLLRGVLERFLASGARGAQPGEFTYRAFRNGRISLLEAEAVAELIEARSGWARKNALSVLAEEGDRWVRELVEALLEIWVPIEADLEFPTDNLDSVRLSDYLEPLRALLERIRDLETRSSRFSKLQEGFRIVLAGAPNVGKSSLLNALLGYNRALVTEIPGTTRDTLEEVFEVDGVPLRLVDTAGLGEAKDALEEAGMERSRDALRKADLAVIVLDLSGAGPPRGPLDPTDYLPDGEVSESCPCLLAGNKEDLLPSQSSWRDRDDLLLVSAKNGTGLKTLIEEIGARLQASGGVDLEERTMLNARQAQTLGRVRIAVERAIENIAVSSPQELVATDLIDANTALEELSGKNIRVDLMESIFSRFCIGK